MLKKTLEKGANVLVHFLKSEKHTKAKASLLEQNLGKPTIYKVRLIDHTSKKGLRCIPFIGIGMTSTSIVNSL